MQSTVDCCGQKLGLAAETIGVIEKAYLVIGKAACPRCGKNLRRIMNVISLDSRNTTCSDCRTPDVEVIPLEGSIEAEKWRFRVIVKCKSSRCKQKKTLVKTVPGTMQLRALKISAGGTSLVAETRELGKGQASQNEKLEAFMKIYGELEEGEGLWVVDSDYKTTHVNPALAKMLGYAREEMLGKNVGEFVSPTWRSVLEKLRTKRRSGIEESHEFQYRRKDGTYILAQVAASPMLDKNSVFLGAFAIVKHLRTLDRQDIAA